MTFPFPNHLLRIVAKLAPGIYAVTVHDPTDLHQIDTSNAIEISGRDANPGDWVKGWFRGDECDNLCFYFIADCCQTIEDPKYWWCMEAPVSGSCTDCTTPCFEVVTSGLTDGVCDNCSVLNTTWILNLGDPGVWSSTPVTACFGNEIEAVLVCGEFVWTLIFRKVADEFIIGKYECNTVDFDCDSGGLFSWAWFAMDYCHDWPATLAVSPCP